MRKSTHIRLANLIAEELGMDLESDDTAYLRGGSTEPDDWGDYPHHYGANDRIVSWILKSRRHFINGNSNSHCECLGIAFHYIADQWTLIGGSDEMHNEWERRIDYEGVKNLKKISEMIDFSEYGVVGENIKQNYLKLFSMLTRVPFGKYETIRYATLSHPVIAEKRYSTPSIDFNMAYRICLGVARSVRSSTRPPENMIKALCLLASYRNWREVGRISPPEDLRKHHEKFIQDMASMEQRLDEQGFFGRIKTKWHMTLTKVRFKSEIDKYLKPYRLEEDWYAPVNLTRELYNIQLQSADEIKVKKKSPEPIVVKSWGTIPSADVQLPKEPRVLGYFKYKDRGGLPIYEIMLPLGTRRARKTPDMRRNNYEAYILPDSRVLLHQVYTEETSLFSRNRANWSYWMTTTVEEYEKIRKTKLEVEQE
jgi:hypothetical protein